MATFLPRSRGPVPPNRDYLIIQVESYSDEPFRAVRKALHTAYLDIDDATTTIKDAPLKEDRTRFVLWRDADELFHTAFKEGEKKHSEHLTALDR